MTNDTSISKRLKQLDIGVGHLVIREGGTDLLPFSQTIVLLFLDDRRHSETTIGQIEDHLKVSNPTASGLVKRLLAKDLVIVTVADDDKRRRLVSITEKGRAAVCTADANIARVDECLFQGFSEDDKVQLLRLLDKLSSNALK